MIYDVIVIGGGPAGMLSAGICGENYKKTLLIEQNNIMGKKLLITGKGRCNVTNYTSAVQDLIANVPTNGRFMFSAFSNFGPLDIMDFFEEHGVSLKVERGNRVFPVSDRSMDIKNALERYVKDNSNIVNDKVTDVVVTTKISDNGKKIKAVKTNSGKVYECENVIIATGGVSYPQTGSTGDGYTFAKKLGHDIIDAKPSLVPLTCGDDFVRELMGLSLKNVEVKVENSEGKIIYKDFGEMLFTHFGVSGPVILSASSHLQNIEKEHYKLYIDLKPALTEEVLDKRIQKDFGKAINKNFENSLNELLPKSIIPIVVRLSGIDKEKKVNQITKEEREKLVSLLKHFKLNISGFRSIKEAIITSGGVSIKNINPKTMESRIVPGIYFAGEVIDVDAYTGGFNLQIAYSTAHAAARAIIGY